MLLMNALRGDLGCENMSGRFKPEYGKVAVFGLKILKELMSLKKLKNQAP